MTFRANQLLKRGGLPRDAKWSKELQDLLEQLPAGEGIDLETWHSGRIWVEAKAITFWEEPARPAMIREILLALNLEPGDWLLEPRLILSGDCRRTVSSPDKVAIGFQLTIAQQALYDAFEFRLNLRSRIHVP